MELLTLFTGANLSTCSVIIQSHFLFYKISITFQNFVRFPFVCVSIGLTIGKVPTVGVVFNPIIDEVRKSRLDHFQLFHILSLTLTVRPI